MPRLRDSDIIHAAATDHRIPRRAGGEDPSGVVAEEPPGGERSLVLFHRELMNERERAEAERDLGVALCEGKPQPADAAVALPLLESALRARPDDLVAWESRGRALARLGRSREGLAALQAALARDPRRVSALVGAAFLAVQAQQYDDAIAYWRRAIAISPRRADYRAELASVHFQNRDPSAAAAACRDTLRLNPADTLSRTLLVRSYLHLGDREAARGELQTLLALDPPFREQLLQRFAPLAGP
jgi:tetratricopeptide (TPR) repeat protein